MLISFGLWALNRLTSLVKWQIDDLAAKPIQIHYHRLAIENQEAQDEGTNPSQAFPNPISTQPKKGYPRPDKGRLPRLSPFFGGKDSCLGL